MVTEKTQALLTALRDQVEDIAGPPAGGKRHGAPPGSFWRAGGYGLRLL